jgi:hypothetical protein
MDAYDVANACRKIELYRDYLAKGVADEMTVVYLTENVKLESLLKQINANGATKVSRKALTR